MGALDFRRAVEQMRQAGMDPLPDRVFVRVPRSRELLWYGIRQFCGERARWLPEYEEVAAWLADNGGRGLLCYGNCGRGKTLLCRSVLPMLLQAYCRRVVAPATAVELNEAPDRWKRLHVLGIDDVGTESVCVRYGERRMVFCEIVDEAERRGKLLLLTTNLSLAEIAERYGERTMDRLVAVTRRVKFVGESLRR